MLGVRTYTRDYIKDCRARVDRDLSTYRKLVAGARKQAPGYRAVTPAIRAFEARFFNNMVLVLNEIFVHRLRTVEGKTGNPLNEVATQCSTTKTL